MNSASNGCELKKMLAFCVHSAFVARKNRQHWHLRHSPQAQSNPKSCQEKGYISPTRPGFWSDGEDGGTAPIRMWSGNHHARGMMWASLHHVSTGAWTILPPNSEMCGNGWHDKPGAFGSASQHAGGAHLLMGDGAVIFVTDSIDAGNSRAPGVAINHNRGGKSPYGLWGALGTRGSGEQVDGDIQ